MILIGGCQSITTSTSNGFSLDLKKSLNISLLGDLVMDYHRENTYWPEDGRDLENFYDGAKLILENFDTLSFRNEVNKIIIEYRFIENPSLPGSIKFVGRDDAGLAKFQIEACHTIYEKSDNNLDGQLLFKYENGYYKCD